MNEFEWIYQNIISAINLCFLKKKKNDIDISVIVTILIRKKKKIEK